MCFLKLLSCPLVLISLPSPTSPFHLIQDLTRVFRTHRYPNAIVDSRASLEYKKQLVGEDSELIAEAHYKLSLALEFASVTTSKEDEEEQGKQSGSQQVDQELRDEAAKELEAAINSTKLKLQNKEVELATLHSPEDNDATRKQIAEVKDIISDMEQRVSANSCVLCSCPPHPYLAGFCTCRRRQNGYILFSETNTGLFPPL